MKLFTLLGGISFVAVVSAVRYKRETDGDYSYNEDVEYASQELDDYPDVPGWFVPTANGSFYWMSKEEWDNTTYTHATGSPEFYLYTNWDPDEPTRIYLNDVKNITNTNFSVSHQTRFLIHGYRNDKSSDFNQIVRSALLATGTYNVIVVDWSSMSSIFYPWARSAVPEVGNKVAQFIDFLNSKIGMSFENLTLVGHSLGAHVAGFAGKHVKNGKIDVIIGLDPAYPLFEVENTTERLCVTDARIVECIQTTSLLGFYEPIGLASFYPNGGREQPGCGVDILRTCGHSRSYHYYAETIRWDNFRGILCETREAAESKCHDEFSEHRMGSPKKYGSAGLYYVPVNDKSPHGVGDI